MTVSAGESGGCDESESCCFVVKQKRWHLHKVVRHFKMSVTGNTLQPVSQQLQSYSLFIQQN